MNNRLTLILFLIISLGLTFAFTYDRKASATIPYLNTRVSVSGSGSEANAASGTSINPVSISGNGRYVAFASTASNLISGDTNNRQDVFVKDTQTGNVSRADVTSSGSELAKGAYGAVSISADGRYVVFASDDTTIAPIYFVNQPHLFVHDMQTGATSLVSNPSSKVISNKFQISGNGRYVVYLEDADGVVAADSNHSPDVYLRDLKTNTLTLMSKNSSGVVSNLGADSPSIDYSGSKVAFTSFSGNLVSGATSYHTDTYLIDRIGGDVITDVTLGSDGNSDSIATLSGDGNTLVFASKANNLVSGDIGGDDVFAYNIANNTKQIVNVDSSGTHLWGYGSAGLGVNSDGTLIVFSTDQANLVSGDTNNVYDVFLRDLNAGTTERVSMRNSTTQTTVASNWPTISSNGKTVAFVSADAGVVAGDTNAVADVFTSSSGTCSN
jgi:hypothetical protein